MSNVLIISTEAHGRQAWATPCRRWSPRRRQNHRLRQSQPLYPTPWQDGACPDRCRLCGVRWDVVVLLGGDGRLPRFLPPAARASAGGG